MKITALSLRSFRSYQSLELPFGDEPANVLVGDNGSGKTNVVEAIGLLSQGRSCLKADLQDILRHGDDFFRIRAEVLSDAGEASSVECVFQTSPKRATAFFRQDVRTPLLQFIGQLPTIIFLPQDLDLFTGSPSGRRGFLDALLSQLRPDYASLRMHYERILKQRNALLKRIAAREAKEGDLETWDAELLESGTRIRALRQEVLEVMAERLPGELKELGETFDAFAVEMIPQGQDFARALMAARARDIIIQTTTVGPHRDDWRMLADGYDAGVTLSRGQQRTLFLGLLFVSAQLFGTVRKEKPVILLDDVLSELDATHQTLLLKRLHDHQVFVTTTHPVDQLTGLRTFEVRDGTIAPV